MQKADSATLRIAKGLSGGLLEEIADGAAALEDVFQATSEVSIQQTVARQARWQKGAIVAADHARLLNELAVAAQRRGGKEISAEIVETYAAVMSAEASCHRAFRTRAE